MSMRWMVTGSRGQLGTCLVRQLESSAGDELLGHADLPELDVAERAPVEAWLRGAPGGPPDVLVNA
ncbi:MAG: NAD(P)-dependent oxidoreductase, partial [Proteobacteria bacterium]|nr:NAD(P)-dependent oxidoreductase [Pseudomonadota bacterium]